jgi:polyferredoxin
MDKIGAERGLIDYLALADEPRERSGDPPRPIWQHVFRLRTMIYTAIWSVIGIGLVWALFVRSDISLTVEPVRNPQFVTLSDGSIRNAYTLRIRNLTGADREFRVSLNSDDILRIGLEADSRLPNHVVVPANETLSVRTYVTARSQDPAASRDRTDFSLWIEAVDSDARAGEKTVFNGKGS